MTKFEYLDVPQRSVDWFAVRMGRVTASRLSDWLAVSKKDGAPLKSRTDYERELWFERKFGVNYNNYISEAMLDGQNFEEFAKIQYQQIKGVSVDPCGIWYNEFFAATPDGLVGDDGILEVKILRDNTFTEVLLTGVPEKHYKQIQGQLWASGRKWCDYVAVNLNTKKIAIWKVTPNAEFQAMLEKSVQEPITVEDVSTNEIYSIAGTIPQALIEAAESDSSNENPWLAQ